MVNFQKKRSAFNLSICIYFMYYTFISIACGSVVNNTLQSPGYPDDYLSNMACIYSVPIPRGTKMKIYFQEFRVDGSFPLLCFL